MASIISAGTTAGTALNMTGDTTGNLAFQTQAGAYTQTMPNTTGTILTTGSPQSGGVIQVVNSTLTTITSTSTTTRNGANTGLSVSITPKFSTSKILVLWQLDAQTQATNSLYVNLLRNGSTELLVGSGGTIGITGRNYSASWVDNMQKASSGTYLDSPATTSATTYALYFWSTGGTIWTNRSANYPDGSVTASTITVMEIAA